MHLIQRRLFLPSSDPDSNRLTGFSLYVVIGIVPMPMPNGLKKMVFLGDCQMIWSGKKQHAVPTKDFTLGAIALILLFAVLKTAKKKKSPVPVSEIPL